MDHLKCYCNIPQQGFTDADITPKSSCIQVTQAELCANRICQSLTIEKNVLRTFPFVWKVQKAHAVLLEIHAAC